MTESKEGSRLVLVRIDAHVISDREYDEIPESTDEDFARGRWSAPRAEATADGPKIDMDVLERFRATGPGWEDRINRILRDAAAAMDAARDLVASNVSDADRI